MRTSSSVNAVFGAAFNGVFGFRTEELFATTAPDGFSVDFVIVFLDFRGAAFARGCFAGLLLPLASANPSLRATGAFSGAATSLTFFELFAIYFCFSSASLYAQSKATQAEISMRPFSSCSNRR